MATNEARELSVPELVKRLGDDTATLIRQELELARAELSQKVDLLQDEVAAIAARVREDASDATERVRGELSENGREAGIGVGFLAAAGGAALLALGSLTAFAILALDGAMSNWAAALIVMAAWAVVAAALAVVGRNRIREAMPLLAPTTVASIRADAENLLDETKERAARDASELVPEQTLESVKEDVEWAKHPKTSAPTSR